MIIDAIKLSFEAAKKKNWDYTYWAVDIHGTMIEPNYKFGSIPTTFFPYAKETMQMLSRRADIKLILFTCSHLVEIEKYLDLFESNDIHFDYINENPEVKTEDKSYGNYDKKMYINVGLDDKFGFSPLEDWIIIKKFLEEI